MNRKVRPWIMFFVIIFASPIIRAGGGGGYDEGCGCADSCNRPSYDYAPPPVVDKSAPSDECLPYLDAERKAAYDKAKTELSCVISADDLAKLKAANERLEQENAELKAKKPASVVVAAPSPVRGKNTVLIRMVKVKRGWSLGYIVEKYRAQFKADLDATVACNGFKGANQTIYPRQIIKVCRWK